MPTVALAEVGGLKFRSDEMKSLGFVTVLVSAWMGVAVTVVVMAQTAAPATAAAPQAPGGGGGRGPSAGSLLWNDKCAGCHGTASAAGKRR